VRPHRAFETHALQLLLLLLLAGANYLDCSSNSNSHPQSNIAIPNSTV
jgi:hypothetical protein